MGNIGEKLIYLSETKSMIGEAIISHGGEVDTQDTFRSYAEKIRNLPITTAEYQKFYDEMTKNGEDWQSLFANKVNLTHMPNINTSKIKNMNSAFYGCRNLTELPIITSPVISSMDSAFRNCEHLISVTFTGDSQTIMAHNAFSGCKDLVSIYGLSLPGSLDDSLAGIFDNTPNLETVEVKNLKVNMELTSPKLTVDSMVYIMSHAKTVTDKTITFGEANLAKLTAEQIEIGTSKGWTIK